MKTLADKIEEARNEIAKELNLFVGDVVDKRALDEMKSRIVRLLQPFDVAPPKVEDHIECIVGFVENSEPPQIAASFSAKTEYGKKVLEWMENNA